MFGALMFGEASFASTSLTIRTIPVIGAVTVRPALVARLNTQASVIAAVATAPNLVGIVEE
jgi:hypothetical protein